MNLKIVWIDDEAEELRFGKRTLEMKGHHVSSMETTHQFLEWLDAASHSDVDIFLLDLMMKIDKEDVERLTGNLQPTERIDTGIYLYNEIREKFPQKPIVVLTIVRKCPDVIKEDRYSEFVLKTPTILPILDAGMKLLGRE